MHCNRSGGTVASFVANTQVPMNGEIGQGLDGNVTWCGGGLFDEIEYHRQKKSLEWELESLLIPELDAAKEAGRLLTDMPRLWAGANLQERHQLLTTMLDAVYIDLKDRRSIVSVKAKPAFQLVIGPSEPRSASWWIAMSNRRTEVTIQAE